MGVWTNIANKLATITSQATVPVRSTYFPEGAFVFTTLVPEGTVIGKNIFYTVNPVYQDSQGQNWGPYLDMSNNLEGIDPLLLIQPTIIFSFRAILQPMQMVFRKFLLRVWVFWIKMQLFFMCQEILSVMFLEMGM